MITNSPEFEKKRGFLYVATGKRHFEEMLLSARSIKKYMPDIPLLLYTDRSDFRSDLFAEVRLLANPQHSFIDKIKPLLETPFLYTVFLDTDTYACAPFYDLFELLDRFELAVSHAPLRHDRPFTTPSVFCELNTGVLAYKLTLETEALFRDWLQLYEKEIEKSGKRDSDQPAFRQALWGSRIPFYVIPPEYNLRTVMPAAVGRYTVRLLHGRSKDMALVERWVNGSHSIRLFLPTPLQLIKAHFSILSKSGKWVSTLLHGIMAPIGFAQKVAQTLKRNLMNKNISS